MPPRRPAGTRSKRKPSSPSPAPASQPVDSQESLNLDDGLGDDEPAQDGHGAIPRINNPDDIAMPSKTKIPEVFYFFDKAAGLEKVTCQVCL